MTTENKNYIDLRGINLYEQNNLSFTFSLTRMREAIDAYEATGSPLGVNGILLTPTQEEDYRYRLSDFACWMGFKVKPKNKKLTFNGITIIKKL